MIPSPNRLFPTIVESVKCTLTPKFGPLLSRFIRRNLGVAARLAFFTAALTGAHAGSATWNSNPASGGWKQASNWTPATVPNGASDTAAFAASSVTEISISGALEVASIVFSPGAGSYRISKLPQFNPSSLVISGAGIINDSGAIQTFDVQTNTQPGSGMISFTNGADAGVATNFITEGGDGDPMEPGGEIIFPIPHLQEAPRLQTKEENLD